MPGEDERALPLDRLLAGQKRALEFAIAGAPLPDLLAALALAFEEVVDQRLLASILLLDPDGRHLRRGAAPSLPPAFSAAIDGTAVAAGANHDETAGSEGRPLRARDIDGDFLWRHARVVVLEHGLGSCWSMPILASDGRVLGVFALHSRDRPGPTRAERDAVELLAHTAALVIERDRDVTQRRLAQANDRFLVQLDDVLRSLGSPEEITQRAAALVGEHLHVDTCVYVEVDAEGHGSRLNGGHAIGIGGMGGQYSFRYGDECWGVMQQGEPCLVADSEADPRIGHDVREGYRAASARAVVCAPVRKEGRLVAVLAVHAARPRTWQRHEVEVVQHVAGRCWESIERVRLMRTVQEALEREQRAREEADAERRRAESASRAKDEFLAMLGHELRNPLSPILTALQLMRLRGSDVVTRERTVIERQVAHLTRLVDDLLDVSRIAQGRIELRMAPVAVADIVRRGIELASPMLEERGHRLTMDVPAEPLVVTGDANRLGQVLANLLTNAAKYTDSGGEITVRARQDGAELVLAVADTGRGITPEALPRIFDLFVQQRQASDRAEGGLGLGLTIVRSLVERHGGRVEARSAGAGQGSEFTVWLPMRGMPSAATPASQPDDAASRAGGRQRVLVVDDNEDGAAMLAAVLDTRGYVVRVAHDGPSALDIADSFQPHVALLDIGLPVMDGYELAIRLRQRPGLADVTLVAVTGYGQSSDKARTRAAGFDHHLVKPVDLAALDGVLSDARLAKRRA